MFSFCLFFFQRMHPRVMHSLPKAYSPDHGNELNGKDTTPPPLKQAILNTPAITQRKVNSLVFDFTFNKVQPFFTVENTSFHKMFEGLSRGRAPVCRKTLRKHVEKTFQNMKEVGTEILHHTQNACRYMDSASQKFHWHHVSLDRVRHIGSQVCCSTLQYLRRSKSTRS